MMDKTRYNIGIVFYSSACLVNADNNKTRRLSDLFIGRWLLHKYQRSFFSSRMPRRTLSPPPLASPGATSSGFALPQSPSLNQEEGFRMRSVGSPRLHSEKSSAGKHKVWTCNFFFFLYNHWPFYSQWHIFHVLNLSGFCRRTETIHCSFYDHHSPIYRPSC